jgi:hypothetical protein
MSFLVLKNVPTKTQTQKMQWAPFTGKLVPHAVHRNTSTGNEIEMASGLKGQEKYMLNKVFKKTNAFC